MQFIKYILVLYTVAFSIIACTKSTPNIPYQDNAFSYFPLEEGNYWLYKAEFISVDASIDIYDTTKLELRMDYEEYDEVLEQHILKRYVRTDSNSTWQDYDVILVKFDSLKLEWYENNLRYVKLTDPVYHLKSWDGNIYNILNSQNYYYSKVNTTFEISDTSYAPCVRIEKNEINNVIQSINAHELFAKEVGPIYEYEEDFSIQAGEINIGFSKELTLMKFGKQ